MGSAAEADGGPTQGNVPVVAYGFQGMFLRPRWTLPAYHR